MQELIRDLIITLHQQEEDADAVILVFLPTYRALEMQHKLLNELKSTSGTMGQAAARYYAMRSQQQRQQQHNQAYLLAHALTLSICCISMNVHHM